MSISAQNEKFWAEPIFCRIEGRISKNCRISSYGRPYFQQTNAFYGIDGGISQNTAAFPKISSILLYDWPHFRETAVFRRIDGRIFNKEPHFVA